MANLLRGCHPPWSILYKTVLLRLPPVLPCPFLWDLTTGVSVTSSISLDYPFRWVYRMPCFPGRPLYIRLAVRVQSDLPCRIPKSVGKSGLYDASNTLFINIIRLFVGNFKAANMKIRLRRAGSASALAFPGPLLYNDSRMARIERKSVLPRRRSSYSVDLGRIS